MSIKTWPAQERPREKLLTAGASSLSDAELLAIFLRTGCAGKSAVDLARELITTFGGLRPLLNASEENFCQGLGLGTAKYAQLQAVLEMARRHLKEALQEKPLLNKSETVKSFVQAHLCQLEHEVFCLILLDNQHRLISFETITLGSINTATVHPREVVKSVLKHNAAAVMLAHNHPSGHVWPSQSDRTLTNHLANALHLIDVPVLDHFIVGIDQVLSFAEHGLMQSPAEFNTKSLAMG